jgi:hypothetical protein
LREVLNVPPEEVAEPQKLPDLFDILWGARHNAPLSAYQSQERCRPSRARTRDKMSCLTQTRISSKSKVVQSQSCENRIQCLKMLLVCFRMNDEVVDVDDHVTDAFDY